LEGQATFDYDNKTTFYLIGGLTTAPKPRAFGTLRYGSLIICLTIDRFFPTRRDRSTSLFVRGDTSLDKSLRNKPNVGGGFAVTQNNMALEVFGTTDSQIGGFVILQPIENIRLAAHGRYDVRSRAIDQGECFVSVTGDHSKGTL
jgi:hypothetical protein